MSRIQIFRAGRHTANSGRSLAFSETDLAATAKAYDPAKHEAPLVVGHPTANAPAYGWVKSLAYSEGVLSAEPHHQRPGLPPPQTPQGPRTLGRVRCGTLHARCRRSLGLRVPRA